MEARRAVSPVVGIALLVGVTVACATALGVLVFSLDATPEEPTPAAVQSTGAFLQNTSTACGNDGITLRHEGGAAIDPASIEFLVVVPDGGHRERIVDLPIEGTAFDDDNFAGDGTIVYDNCARGPITDGGEPWTAGQRVTVELNSGVTGADIDPGDEIHVTVVHEPSGGVLVSERIVAQ